MKQRQTAPDGVSNSLVIEDGKTSFTLKFKFTDGSTATIMNNGESGTEIEFYPAD